MKCPRCGYDLAHETPQETQSAVSGCLQVWEPPEWLTILSQHPKWLALEDPKGYAASILYTFPNLDLSYQAKLAYDWLNTTAKGKRKKDIPRFWMNWLKRAEADRVKASQGAPTRSTRVEAPRDRSVYREA